jgi:hypothetical protein
MPVSHRLKTTGIFYTRKYFSIEKNRNQRFFFLIVSCFIVFSPGFFNWGGGGLGLGLVLIIPQREHCSKLM